MEDEYAKVDKSRRNEAPDLGDVTATVVEEAKPVARAPVVSPASQAPVVTQAPPAAAPPPTPVVTTAATTSQPVHTTHVTQTTHSTSQPTNHQPDTQ